MNSLYSNYLTEKTHDKIIETGEGFVTYRFLNERQVYIVDIYVIPYLRLHGVASRLADFVCEEARSLGYKELIGTVNLANKDPEDSVRTLLGYKMKIDSCSDGFIVFKKEL